MEENNKIIAEFMNFPKITNVRDSESGKYYDYWLPNNFNLILEQEIQIESNNGWGLVHQDCVFVRDLIFHSDWNWLMEVVEKIEGLEFYPKNSTCIGFDSFEIEINKNRCDITRYGDFTHLLLQGQGKTRIEAVYNACIEFIKWYNEQNK